MKKLRRKLKKSIPGVSKKVLIIALLVLSMLLLIFISVKNDKSCSEASKDLINASRISPGENASEVYKKAYEQLEADSKHCEGKNISNSPQDSNKNFEYFYKKATIGYSIGKYEESKKDADKAIELYEELPKPEKSSRNNTDKLRALQDIKRGTY